jgi:hypothetical protein
MNGIREKKRLRKRICEHCKEFYLPDYRNRYHQCYCSKPECRLASKKASQRKWLGSDKGDGYFKGSWNVEHVQQWRKAHPGYWKRKQSHKKDALQEDCFSQLESNQGDTGKLKKDTLQDVCSSQLPLLLGLIAILTGNTLQDDIAKTSRRFIDLGHDILGTHSHLPEQGGTHND